MINAASNIFAPSTENIAAAAAVIREGGLIAFPTETVYGLGADATNDRAVASIFEAKDRPRFNPLIVHFASSSEAGNAAAFDARAHRLAGAFWPGALTLVLERRSASAISLLVSAGLETLAVRVPAHPVAQALLAAAKRPIAAPSANRRWLRTGKPFFIPATTSATAKVTSIFSASASTVVRPRT